MFTACPVGIAGRRHVCKHDTQLIYISVLPSKHSQLPDWSHDVATGRRASPGSQELEDRSSLRNGRTPSCQNGTAQKQRKTIHDSLPWVVACFDTPCTREG